MLEHLQKYGVCNGHVTLMEDIWWQPILQSDRVHPSGGDWHGECCVRV
jgi:hypothetical protein